eukprot:m.110986 g.110986  ORF g.110986 m.110986 type:complete len:202 (-) comp15935_c0_seq2:1341-1946(-)
MGKGVIAKLQSLDRRLSEQLYIGDTRFEQALWPMFKMLEWSGHGVLWIGLAIFAFLAYPESAPFSLNLLAALLFDLCVVSVCKGLVRRSRPVYNRGDAITLFVDQFSFPSGHCTRAFMLVPFLSSSSTSDRDEAASLYWMLLAWALHVAASRLALGRHYLSDVLAGALIGLLQFQAFLLVIALPVHACFAARAAFPGATDL